MRPVSAGVPCRWNTCVHSRVLLDVIRLQFFLRFLFVCLFCGIKRLRCVLYFVPNDSSVLPSWLLGRPPDPSSVEPLLLSTVDSAFPGTRL